MRSKPVILPELFDTTSYDKARELFRRRLDTLLPLWSWSKLQVPYYASNHPILPSVEDIQQAMRTDKDPYSPVCRISSLVVKEGSSGHVVQVNRSPVHIYESEGTILTRR
jgi:hypothetical protein